MKLFTGDILAIAASKGRVFTVGADGSLRCVHMHARKHTRVPVRSSPALVYVQPSAASHSLLLGLGLMLMLRVCATEAAFARGFRRLRLQVLAHPEAGHAGGGPHAGQSTLGARGSVRGARGHGVHGRLGWERQGGGALDVPSGPATGTVLGTCGNWAPLAWSMGWWLAAACCTRFSSQPAVRRVPAGGRRNGQSKACVARRSACQAGDWLQLA